MSDPYYQFEDKLRQAIAAVILGKSVPFADSWRQFAVVDNPKGREGSRNWMENSFGLCCLTSHQPGIDGLALVMSAPNDELGQEATADSGHDCFNFEALMNQRRGLRALGHPLAAASDARVLQFWATRVLCADQLSNPIQSVFLYAHQRSTTLKTGAGLVEYYFRRGLPGVTHTSTGLGNAGSRGGNNQEPFTPKLFADWHVADIQQDVARIMDAYRIGGKRAVAKFIVKGTRGVYDTVVFKNGGYLHRTVDFGIDEPRLVIYKQSAMAKAEQYPPNTLPRQKGLADSSNISDDGKVTASCQGFPSYSAQFSLSDVEFWQRTSPVGIEIKFGGGGSGAGVLGSSPTGGDSVNPDAPVSAPPPPVTPKPKKTSNTAVLVAAIAALAALAWLALS